MNDYPPTEEQLGEAARAWCHPTTKHLVMESALAEVFASMLASRDVIIEELRHEQA